MAEELTWQQLDDAAERAKKALSEVQRIVKGYTDFELMRLGTARQILQASNEAGEGVHLLCDLVAQMMGVPESYFAENEEAKA